MKNDRMVKYHSWFNTVCEFFRRSPKLAKIC